MRWLKSLWSRERPTPPILVRAREPNGDAPPILDVETTWGPSGTRIERSVRTADGLAVVHWLEGQDRVELVVRSTMGQATVEIERAGYAGRVIDLQLMAVDSWAPSERLDQSASAA